MKLLSLRGDGIGPEIVSATERVLKAADGLFELELSFRTEVVGFDALAAEGSTIPGRVVEAALAADGIILGPVSHNDYPPVAEGGLNPSGTLRKKLDLYANIRPAVTRPGIAPPCGTPFELVVVRENTEGFYADRNMESGPGEFMPDPDMALSLRKVTRGASRRIAQAAFDLAAMRPARHVTAVHKANVLRLSDGLFLEETRAVAAQHPDIRYDEVLVDAMAAHLVRDPSRYDTIVTTNMYGDILSDLASELSGSLGLAASLNAGTSRAMAQAQHGSAPDIAGQGKANPASLILSAAMLLDWGGRQLGRQELCQAALGIELSVAQALQDPSARTPDLGGTGSTGKFTDSVITALALAGRT